MNPIPALIVAALLALPVHGALAGEVEDVVSRAAHNWLADRVKQEQWPDARVDVVVLPNRRPAPSCGQALKVLPVDTARMSRLRFSARCPDGTAETYTVRAAVHTKALAVAAAIPAGKTIDKNDLKRVDADIVLLPDATLKVDDIAGRAAQRPLRAGQVVQMRFLKNGEGVRRGQVVQIVSRQPQFQISTMGTVMQKADHDALVRVRNDATGKLIMARVVGTGVVEPVVDGT
ncbi:flagellar basal body P-ring formation protein FlgA [Dyella sp. M7H15-1]|uniref:flagellar basal body P-ring formation chaperone FlgA n=1 Tax=Dyella sp. M7H15-1 TaxID=2501295 RepID=UPI001004D8DC|nr:flagellar basal body P-ring formation chaperone FlgA [Dyella sp. M7H15-1]QAU23970.1 flagellar basal body P-ring formation protein FlgA [Dyella sp. M7H15-1]